MLKVVLIDDEQLVIEGLLEMIDWHGHGYKIAGIANDGLSGYELINEVMPDLVITDIRMPELDGLEMIERCRKQIKKDIRFLVLSGYNEFSYIKAAMDLKSLSYILKPIDPEEIHPLLTQIFNQHEQAQYQMKRLNENIQWVTQMTLNRIIVEPNKRSLIDRALFLLDYKANMGFSSCVLKSVEMNNPSFKKAFFELNTILDSFKLSGTVITESEDEMLILIYGDYKQVQKLIQSVENKLYKHDDVAGIRWVFSLPLKDLNDLKSIAKKVKSRLELTFYDNAFFDMVTNENVYEFSTDVSLVDFSEIIVNISALEKEDLDHYLNCVFRSIRQSKINPQIIGFKWENFLLQMESMFHTHWTPLTYRTFCEFKEVCKSAVFFYYELQHSRKLYDITDNIKEFIEAHFHEDLRLKTLSKHFGYNSVYLGQLFLKEKGIKFNDYLLEVRLQKARKLLLYSDKSIKEVAREVGFKNPDYFLQKFKEVEGILPSLYRL